MSFNITLVQSYEDLLPPSSPTELTVANTADDAHQIIYIVTMIFLLLAIAVTTRVSEELFRIRRSLSRNGVQRENSITTRSDPGEQSQNWAKRTFVVVMYIVCVVLPMHFLGYVIVTTFLQEPREEYVCSFHSEITYCIQLT